MNDKPVWIISYLEIFTPSSNNNNEEPKLDIEETCLSARSGILNRNFHDIAWQQVSNAHKDPKKPYSKKSSNHRV